MIEKYNLKNGETRYKVNIYLGIDSITGKQARTTLRGFKTKKEAKLAEVRKIKEFEKNGHTLKKDEQVSHVTNFNDVFDMWFKEYKTTIQASTYSSQLGTAKKHILPKFDNQDVRHITKSYCKKVVNEWYSSYTKANNLLSITRRIFDYAVDQLEVLDENPMRNIITPRNTHKKDYEAPFYSKEELNTFFEAVQDETTQTKLIFRILAYCGLRKGELLGLRWSDFDEVNNTLSVNRAIAEDENNKPYVKPPKNKASKRTLGLDLETAKQLRHWKTEQKEMMFKLGYNTSTPENYIFTNEKNNHMNYGYPYQLLKRLLKKYKLKKITLHGFRHTHVVLLSEIPNIPIDSIQERLGHNDFTTTMNIYNAVNNSKPDDTGEMFAKYVNS